MADLDFSGACTHAERLMIDWEDKGIIELLDMDRIICNNEDKRENGIVPIYHCRNCGHASLEDTELSEEELDMLVRWTTLGRFVTDVKTEDDSAECLCIEDCAE